MMRLNMPSKNKGVTLIELLIALGISSILVAALYRTFIGQQKTYIVQDQVVDMQQNVRVAINKMMRDVRMAGFGGDGDFQKDIDGLHLGPYVLDVPPNTLNGFTQVITPNNDNITIVGGFKQVSTLAAEAAGGKTQVTLASAADASQFDGAAHHFISIGGTESNIVSSRAGAVLTLSKGLKLTHKITDSLGNPVSIPIFKIQAITYVCGISDGKPVLQRNENTGGGGQPLAEDIESVQFQYFDANCNDVNCPPLALPIANPGIIRMVRVTVTARTNMVDTDFKGGDGYRRRTIDSNIQIRNMGN
jgi:prepilin-type N-terminal cleavage/methylation domain-containing protein